MDGRQRRKLVLELTSLTAVIASSVGFSGAFVAHWGAGASGRLAATTAVVVLLLWTAVRLRRPPVPKPWSVEDLCPDAGGVDEPVEESRRARVTGWLIALVVVGGFFVLAIAVRFFVPLWVVLGFAILDSSSALGDVMIAAMCTVAVGLGVEWGIVEPLSRRWDVDVDGVIGIPADLGPAQA
ncbi:hypothetical protein ABFT23_10585 [Nocardioides sp. C4-1]|uniref:hypothetical protein n=1 Tax=Nocardioides sp. C4-1 TaxID=3151851 RepID=UPI0032672030